MAAGGPGFPRIPAVFQARLNTDLGGVSDTLTLLPYKGNTVTVRSQQVTIPNAGMTRDIADNLIDATGADSGSTGAPNNLFYVYVSNSRASFSPRSIRLSAQPPVLVLGVKYLGSSGNALNWRFVGWVLLNATPQFESSDTNAWIANYYNRIVKGIFANPGYVDDNAQNSYAVNGNWAAVHGGVDSQIGFISNGEDAVDLASVVTTSAVTGIQLGCGVGIDGSPPLRSAFCVSNGLVSFADLMSTSEPVLLAEGNHTADLYGSSQGGAGSFIADDIRQGAAADPRLSMVTAKVMV